MKRVNTAIIDIGSNSVRLMFAENEGLNKKHLYSTVLAEGLQVSGKLSEHAIERTVNAIAECVALSHAHNCNRVFAFATEAVRAASNGSDFTTAVKSRCGIDVDVISGSDEAMLGFMGAAEILPKPITVIDIGGASVELVNGNSKIDYAVSLPLGVVRLNETFGKDVSALKEFLGKEIKNYGVVPPAPLVGIGGTATALSAMNMGLAIYDENKVHQSSLTLTELDLLTEQIFASHDLLGDFPTLSPNRAKVIGQGAVLLSMLMKYLGQEKITISEYDNIEGYIVYKNI